MKIIAEVQKSTGIDIRSFYPELRGAEGWINEEFYANSESERREMTYEKFYEEILPKILAKEGFQE